MDSANKASDYILFAEGKLAIERGATATILQILYFSRLQALKEYLNITGLSKIWYSKQANLQAEKEQQ